MDGCGKCAADWQCHTRGSFNKEQCALISSLVLVRCRAWITAAGLHLPTLPQCLDFHQLSEEVQEDIII